MGNYSTLKNAIQTTIKQNGNNEITGALLQDALLSMINSLGAGYQFAGIATPSTNPGTPDQRVFYITGQPGVYSNFGGASVTKLGVLYYDTTWHLSQTDLSFISGGGIMPCVTNEISVDFSTKTFKTETAGYLFDGTNTARQIVSATVNFSALGGLCYIVRPYSGTTPYIIEYSSALQDNRDYIFGMLDITGGRIHCFCRKLTVNGETIRDYSAYLYRSDAPEKFIRSEITVDLINKTMAWTAGYAFLGRAENGFVLSIGAGSTSWNENAHYYIVYSVINNNLYVVRYDGPLNYAGDIIVGNINMPASRVVIDCSKLTVNGEIIRDFYESNYNDLAAVVNVTPMPTEAETPTAGWGNKPFNTVSGTDGIFWDVRNIIGPGAKIKNINLLSGSAGTVRIHYLDANGTTLLYEDHVCTSGLNTFAPTANIDYTNTYYVGFQNLTSKVRLIYPSDGTGQTRKKFISDGHIVEQTLAYALWLNVYNMTNTLPYRVTQLENGQETGIDTLAKLKSAIASGYAKIELGECDITLDATLSIPSGTKITGVRGKSILRVPSGVLKGIELNVVEDVVIENITLIGAYNGTPLKTGLQPVKPGIVDTADAARQFTNAGYQTDMTNGGVTSTYVPQIGINIRQCEKVEIIGCEIKNFSFYGIANALSGKNYRYAMKVENNYINNCYCGLYLYKEAERAQYIANNIALCQIGVYLDSGTNMFTDNAFSANRIAMFMNNGVNHAHGVQTGNAFTHCSLFSLYAYNVENGEVFTQCKFGYVDSEAGNQYAEAAIWLKNSRGLFFNNCQMIICNSYFDGKFYLAYNGYTSGSADQFGNTNYVVSYTDISGQASQYNGGVNEMLGCSFISGGGHINISDDLDETNVILKFNANITGNTYPNVNN